MGGETKLMAVKGGGETYRIFIARRRSDGISGFRKKKTSTRGGRGGLRIERSEWKRSERACQVQEGGVRERKSAKKVQPIQRRLLTEGKGEERGVRRRNEGILKTREHAKSEARKRSRGKEGIVVPDRKSKKKGRSEERQKVFAW